MNHRMIVYILGHIMKLEAAAMFIPLCVSFYYNEDLASAYLIPIITLLVIGLILGFLPIKERLMRAKDGLFVVVLSWIVLSFFGAWPFFISGEIPSFVNALFESVSGFTTTGATILTDVALMSKSLLFWRAFMHWMGGMGVLVLVIAILPKMETQTMHILRAEMPGPSIRKLVSKASFTARILYGIYIALTLLQVMFLVVGKMPLFDSVVTAFSTAGTGGFATDNASMALYDSQYLHIVVAIFMMIFSVNFNLYYLLLLRNFKEVRKNDELRWYLGIVFFATLLIFIDIRDLYDNVGVALIDSFFQVTSITSTTGFATTDFDLWPTFSNVILVLLMIIGACAGSTGGGVKVSRIMLMVKDTLSGARKTLHPRLVTSVKMEDKRVDPQVLKNVSIFLSAYCLIFCGSTLLISVDNFDFISSATAAITTLGNVGPGLGLVGPTGNYAPFSGFSKMVLCFNMLAGRLEIFPLFLLWPTSWKR